MFNYATKLKDLNLDNNLKNDELSEYDNSFLVYLPLPNNISLIDRIKMFLFCHSEADKIKILKPYYQKNINKLNFSAF